MKRNRSRRLMLALAATLVAAAPGRAQDVRPVVDQLARSWDRGEAGAISSAASRGGVSVDVDGDHHGPLNARQLSAVLRRLFDERETMQVRAGTAKVVEGSPGRAYGELAWTVRMRGTTQPQRSTIFLGFVLEDDRWRLTEIRVLR